MENVTKATNTKVFAWHVYQVMIWQSYDGGAINHENKIMSIYMYDKIIEITYFILESI